MDQTANIYVVLTAGIVKSATKSQGFVVPVVCQDPQELSVFMVNNFNCM